MAFENGLNPGIILQGTPTTHPVLPQTFSDQLQANAQLGQTTAQTGYLQANTGLVGAQTQNAELQNQVNSIQLQQRQAAMKIAQEMATQYKGGQPTSTGGNGNSQGAVSPGEGLQTSVPPGSMPVSTPGPSQSTATALLGGGQQGSNAAATAPAPAATPTPTTPADMATTTPPSNNNHATDANYNNLDYMNDYFNRLSGSGAYTPQEIFAMRKDFSNANSGMVKAAADADKSVAEANAAKEANTSAATKAAKDIQEYIGQAGLPIAKALQAGNTATVNALVPQFASHMGDLAVTGAASQLPPGQVLTPQQEQQIRTTSFNQWGNTNDPAVVQRLKAITAASTAGQELQKTNSTLALQSAETSLAGANTNLSNANTSNVKQKTGLEATAQLADTQADIAAKQNMLNKTNTAIQLAQQFSGGKVNATLNDFQNWLGNNPEYAEYKALLAPENLSAIKSSLAGSKLNQSEYQAIAPTQVNAAMPTSAVINLLKLNQAVQSQQLNASQLQAGNIAKVTSGSVPYLNTSGATNAATAPPPSQTSLSNPSGVKTISGPPPAITQAQVTDYARRNNMSELQVINQLKAKGVNVP